MLTFGGKAAGRLGKRLPGLRLNASNLPSEGRLFEPLKHAKDELFSVGQRYYWRTAKI
jgi:hypothetical protein